MSSSPRVALATSRQEDSVQVVLAGSKVVAGSDARVHLGPADTEIPGQSTLCTSFLATRRVTDRSETAALDRRISPV